jgi:LmbE family N-acetylglucosaminyl deacetylase
MTKQTATATPGIDLLVVSAHFDDAALSCGGAIELAVRRGERVTVVTVCAAPPDGPLSDYAASLHRRWGAAAGTEQQDAVAMVRRRLIEDRAALAILGATGCYLDVADCIYRRSPVGAWLYESDAALFGSVATEDVVTEEHIAGLLSDLPGVSARTLMLVPLGVGQHVDHQLARQAAELLAADSANPLAYYEDYPYAGDPSQLQAALAAEHGLVPKLITLDARALAARIESVRAYSSQISSFWPDAEAMAEALREFAGRTGAHEGPAERWWVPE